MLWLPVQRILYFYYIGILANFSYDWIFILVRFLILFQYVESAHSMETLIPIALLTLPQCKYIKNGPYFRNYYPDRIFGSSMIIWNKPFCRDHSLIEFLPLPDHPKCPLRYGSHFSIEFLIPFQLSEIPLICKDCPLNRASGSIRSIKSNSFLQGDRNVVRTFQAVFWNIAYYFCI